MISMLAQTYEKTLWMPIGASPFADDVDQTFYFIYWVSVFFFVLIGGCMFWFAWKYRQKDKNYVPHGVHHNNTLEITWSVIPLIIVMVIFMWGFRGLLDMSTPPGEAYEVFVDAKKWSWTFSYPEGGSSPILHVPADTPIRLVLSSQDVLHSFFVPAFRQKKDVVPGRYNKTWFETPWDPALAKDNTIILPGGGYEGGEPDNMKFPHPTIVYDMYCTEYCGTRHSWMWSKVVVHPKEAWPTAIGIINTVAEGAEGGAQLYSRRGCNACHSVDGSAGIGPTFRDLFGRQEQTNAGPVTADENYIRESIKNPGAKIVTGYANQMPLVPFTDDEINKVIAWLKTISTHSGITTPGQQLQPGNELPPQTLPTKEEAHGNTATGDQGVDPNPQEKQQQGQQH